MNFIPEICVTQKIIYAYIYSKRELYYCLMSLKKVCYRTSVNAGIYLNLLYQQRTYGTLQHFKGITYRSVVYQVIMVVSYPYPYVFLVVIWT